MKIKCAACGYISQLQDKAGFRDTCPSCDAWLHNCANCALWINSQCTEPSAEKVRDPEGMNFCDWFREIDADFADSRETTGGRDTAEDLWKKLTKK